MKTNYIHCVIRSCTQTLHALRILHAHDMSTSVLQEVYRAIVIGKLCYASSAWRGFTLADDWQHLDSFIRCSVCQGYCASDLDIVGIIDQADEKLFQFVLTNPNHVLSSLLPDKTDRHYYLRARRHDRQLVDKCTKLFSNNFMIHVLYRHCYWLYISCVLTTFDKDDDDDDDKYNERL